MFNYTESEANSPYWDRFLREGEELYNYMITNILSMIDENNMKYFTIKPTYSNLDVDCSVILKEHGEDIKKELVKWIKQEYDNNSLINDQMWKPRRDACYDTEMSLGYIKIFQYTHYYFILCIDTKKRNIRFKLLLYGSKDSIELARYMSPNSDDIILRVS